jgi:signal transduction histidine kinase
MEMGLASSGCKLYSNIMLYVRSHERTSMSNPFLDNDTNDLQDNSIEHLPTATRTKLRSTQILTSISQIVSELLQNSLDAGARHIEIGVDCEEWSCWVRDDGAGMSKDAMNLLGKGPEDGRYGE